MCILIRWQTISIKQRSRTCFPSRPKYFSVSPEVQRSIKSACGFGFLQLRFDANHSEPINDGFHFERARIPGTWRQSLACSWYLRFATIVGRDSRVRERSKSPRGLAE